MAHTIGEYVVKSLTNRTGLKSSLFFYVPTPEGAVDSVNAT